MVPDALRGLPLNARIFMLHTSVWCPYRILVCATNVQAPEKRRMSIMPWQMLFFSWTGINTRVGEWTQMARYPRKGEHGDPRPRCRWCGRTYERGILDPMGQIPYCSFKCRMAGYFWFTLCSAMVSTFFATGTTNFFLGGGAGAALIMPFLLMFWSIAVFLWAGAYVGYRVRSASSRQRDEGMWDEGSDYCE